MLPYPTVGNATSQSLSSRTCFGFRELYQIVLKPPRSSCRKLCCALCRRQWICGDSQHGEDMPRVAHFPLSHEAAQFGLSLEANWKNESCLDWWRTLKRVNRSAGSYYSCTQLLSMPHHIVDSSAQSVHCSSNIWEATHTNRFNLIRG